MSDVMNNGWMLCCSAGCISRAPSRVVIELSFTTTHTPHKYMPTYHKYRTDVPPNNHPCRLAGWQLVINTVGKKDTYRTEPIQNLGYNNFKYR